MRSFSRCLLVIIFCLLSPAAFAQTAGTDSGSGQDPVAERFATITALQSQLKELKAAERSSTGEEQAAISERTTDARDKLGEAVRALVADLNAATASDTPPPPDAIKRAKELLKADARRLKQDREELAKAMSKAKDAAASATSPEERSALDAEIAKHNERIVALFSAQLDNTDLRASLGDDTAKDLAAIDDALTGRAHRLAALISAAREERDALKGRPTTTDDEKAAQSRDVELAQKRIDAAAASLSGIIKLLKRRDIPTTEHQQLLIETTGRVTTDVLDAKVTAGLVDAWLHRAQEWAVERAPGAGFTLLLFALIMAASWGASRIVRSLVGRSVGATGMSALAKDFVTRSSGRAVLAVGALTGLSQLGIEMAPVLAGLGIAGFVVGFALQDTLSNFASGLMILVYRPFDVGDLIEVAGVTGIVEQMTLVSTSVLTLDNQQLVIPNNKIWNDVIRNITAQSRRRVDFLFGVSYDDDIDHASAVLRDIVTNVEHVETESEITVEVHEFGESSINFVVRAWAPTEHYWAVFWAVNAEVKRRFDAEGISIPYPQRDLHFINPPPEKTA